MSKIAKSFQDACISLSYAASFPKWLCPFTLLSVTCGSSSFSASWSTGGIVSSFNLSHAGARVMASYCFHVLTLICNAVDFTCSFHMFIGRLDILFKESVQPRSSHPEMSHPRLRPSLCWSHPCAACRDPAPKPSTLISNWRL